MNGTTREPNFLIVGAAKAGTTSLAAYLAGHPDVFMATEKELHFFDRERMYARGWDWYCGRFAAAEGATAVGEATPTYLAMPKAVERIAHHLPRARLIAILRNPVDRAYSYYWHLRAYRAEARSFEAALADPQTEERVGYLARGRYAEQLNGLYAHFPADQVHVVLFDDLLADPQGTVATTCQWLGVPALDSLDLDRNYNPRFRLRSPALMRAMRTTHLWRRWPGMAQRLQRLNRAPISTPPMAPETRARLVEAFAPANAELAALIDRDLSAWNR